MRQKKGQEHETSKSEEGEGEGEREEHGTRENLWMGVAWQTKAFEALIPTRLWIQEAGRVADGEQPSTQAKLSQVKSKSKQVKSSQVKSSQLSTNPRRPHNDPGLGSRKGLASTVILLSSLPALLSSSSPAAVQGQSVLPQGFRGFRPGRGTAGDCGCRGPVQLRGDAGAHRLLCSDRSPGADHCQ